MRVGEGVDAAVQLDRVGARGECATCLDEAQAFVVGIEHEASRHALARGIEQAKVRRAEAPTVAVVQVQRGRSNSLAEGDVQAVGVGGERDDFQQRRVDGDREVLLVAQPAAVGHLHRHGRAGGAVEVRGGPGEHAAAGVDLHAGRVAEQAVGQHGVGVGVAGRELQRQHLAGEDRLVARILEVRRLGQPDDRDGAVHPVGIELAVVDLPGQGAALVVAGVSRVRARGAEGHRIEHLLVVDHGVAASQAEHAGGSVVARRDGGARGRGGERVAGEQP